MFIDYENTFEVKTGKGHCKLSFETKNVKIGSYLGSPGVKNCSKKDRNFINLSSQALWTLLIDYGKTFEIKTGVEHYKISFETINIEV